MLFLYKTITESSLTGNATACLPSSMRANSSRMDKPNFEHEEINFDAVDRCAFFISTYKKTNVKCNF